MLQKRLEVIQGDQKLATKLNSKKCFASEGSNRVFHMEHPNFLNFILSPFELTTSLIYYLFEKLILFEIVTIKKIVFLVTPK